jgi:predicted anti-sigma-YlaC factor YlaD
MTRDPHDEARELIALGEGLSDTQQTRLRAHLQECRACGHYAEAAGRAVRTLRSQPLAADSSLVRATQMRVRQRALELQRQQERLWVICVCCVAVTLGTALTTAVLWGGFAWIGHQARLPGPVWQICLLALGLMPAIVVAILLLARGTHLADHNGSLPPGLNQQD